MAIDDKFRFDEPADALLQELGDIVDHVEGAIHARLDYRVRLSELNSRLITPMTEEEICTYAASRSRDDFIRAHLTPDPHGHSDLTDQEMIWIIEQMLGNLDKDYLLHYYSRILEMNAACPEGTVMSLPAFQEMGDPGTILTQLRSTKRVFHL